jgi:hypothetical protein
MDNMGRQIMDLRAETPIETHRTELNGDKQAGTFPILAHLGTVMV